MLQFFKITPSKSTCTSFRFFFVVYLPKSNHRRILHGLSSINKKFYILCLIFIKINDKTQLFNNHHMPVTDII